MTIYELLQSVSQGENGTLYGENEELALVANDIIGATTSGRDDEKESANSVVDAVRFVEMEQRKAEKWAIEHNRWIPFSDVFDLGLPGPSGVGKFENDQFLLSDLLPKNALKDNTGDVFIIDAEISLK